MRFHLHFRLRNPKSKIINLLAFVSPHISVLFTNTHADSLSSADRRLFILGFRGLFLSVRRWGQVGILALQSDTLGGGSVAVAPMAQPNAEPVEEYEYVFPSKTSARAANAACQFTDARSNSYEALPPNFSLLQNMAAGAFAGIAVSISYPGSICALLSWRSAG